MDNSIEINGIKITVSGKHSDMVYVAFARGNKVIKTINSDRLATSVKPETLPKVQALVDAYAATLEPTKAVSMRYVVDETPEERICRERQEQRDAWTPEQRAAHEAELDEVETHQRRMARVMAVQG